MAAVKNSNLMSSLPCQQSMAPKGKHCHWVSKSMFSSYKTPKRVSRRPKFNPEHLGDDILVEILHRLPYKQAFICKSVSKRLNSLISGPQFLRQFISRWQYIFQRHDQHCSFVANSSHLLLIPNLPSESLDSLGPNLETALSSLNSLSASLPNEILQSHREILGYSNGLLLLNIYHSDVNDYVVFDMITKQLIKLPPGPRLPPFPSTFQWGLVCHRNYMETANQRAAATKFFVVLATRNMSGRYNDIKELPIYSSESGQWRSLSVNFPTWMLVSAGVSHHGLLYFLGARRGLIVCDPMHFTSHFFRFPYDRYGETKYNGKKFDNYEQCIGVCCGTMRLCQATHVNDETVNVMVWELRGFDKETELGFWDLVHNVYLGPAPGIWKYNGTFQRRNREIEPLAFHPYNGDILYFKHRSSIFSCNFQSKTLEDIPVSGNVDCFRHSMARTLPILVPCWPANPLPKQ